MSGIEKVDLKGTLGNALKVGQLVMRFDMPDNESLVALEKFLQDSVQSKVKASALVSMTPQFDWWQEAALWPIYPTGWTVLLRRVIIRGQVQQNVDAAARQAMLAK